MLGTSKNDPDLFYATKFDAPDPVAAVSFGDGSVLLVVGDMELGRARRTAGEGVRTETAGTLGLDVGSSAGPVAALRETLLREGVFSVDVGENFPFGAAADLERAGIEVRAAAASPFAKARETKTPAEIAAIRASQRAARAAERALGAALRESEPDSRGRLVLDGAVLTSERARKIVRETLLAHGTMDFDGTIVAGGLQAADPHEQGHGPLLAGQTIVADIFPRSLSTGYWGDMTRTFHRGRLTPDLKKMRAAVAEAQKVGIEEVRPGATGAGVHAAVRAVFEKLGFRSGVDSTGRPYGFIHSTGHGVGLEIHEEPRLSPSGGPLRPGMVVTVEPGLYYPGVGGVRIEDTVLVVPSGREIL